MSTNDAIIIPLLEGMDQKELLTVISIANGLIKTKMEDQKQQQGPVGDLIKTIAAILISAGLDKGEDIILGWLHPHKKTIAMAAVPVTEEIAEALKCQPGFVLVNGVCVPEIGG